MSTRQRWSVIKFLFPWFMLLVVTSCGTTTDYAGGGIGGTGISVGKITSAGATSVNVNGVAFDITGATVTMDGIPGSQNNLKVGMIVKVEGTFNPDGTTGAAVYIEFKDILEGSVDSVSPNSLVVLGQTVSVSSSTHYDDFADINGDGTIDVNDVQIGNIVEVSGFVDKNGIIHASYISLKSLVFEGDGSKIELKGIITYNPDTLTFTIGSLTIGFLSAELETAARNAADNALYVEVKSSAEVIDGVLIASEIEIEERGHHVESGHELEVEGYVTALLTDTTFEIEGQIVQITSTTYKDGNIVNIADIAVDMKIEVEGTVDASGVLIADKIKIESGDDGNDGSGNDSSNDSPDDSDNGSGDDAS